MTETGSARQHESGAATSKLKECVRVRGWTATSSRRAPSITPPLHDSTTPGEVAVGGAPCSLV